MCIVGAGPGGLAALSAVLEPYCLDELAEDQARRAAHTAPPRRPSVCVVDPQPWLAAWRARFAALGIRWLRSPAMAHPDTFDAWSLREFAHLQGRESELQATDAESWKPVRGLGQAQAGFFSLPSSQLFLDFCDSLVARLPHTFVRSKVASVGGADGAFEVGLSDGSSISAKSVVLALGVPGPAIVPPAFAHLPAHTAFHTEDYARLQGLKRGSRVLVVGGGLTAVQAAQLAVRKGCRVSICSRRRLATRSFDIPVDWFDYRTQGRLRHDFWQLPPEERLMHLRATKGGGSVPPFYMEDVRASEAAGQLEVVCGEAEVGAADAEGLAVKLAGRWRRFDRVVLACGHRPDCAALPLLRELQAQWPVPVVGGLPMLSKDLQWGPHAQLFLVGALAALQVGPDAANLMGCRRAALVVAKVLGLRLWQRSFQPKDGSVSICGNRYAVLSDSEDDDDETTVAESLDSLPDSGSAEEQHPDHDGSVTHVQHEGCVDSKLTGAAEADIALCVGEHI